MFRLKVCINHIVECDLNSVKEHGLVYLILDDDGSIYVLVGIIQKCLEAMCNVSWQYHGVGLPEF